MVPYNWLFDPGLYADGSERKWCPYESSSGGAVGYGETDSERWGRWGLQRLSFEEHSDNATLGALETTSTPAQRSRAIYQAAQLCPTVCFPKTTTLSFGVCALYSLGCVGRRE